MNIKVNYTWIYHISSYCNDFLVTYAVISIGPAPAATLPTLWNPPGWTSMLFFLRSLHRRALSHKQVPRLKHAAAGQGGIVQRTAWVLESLLCCIQTNSTFSSPSAHASSLTGSSLSAVFFIELAQIAALTWHFDAWRWLQKHRVLMKIDRPWLHNHTPSPLACLAVGLTGKTHIFHRSSLWQPTVWTYIRAGPRTGSRTSASEQTGKLSSIQKDVQWRTPGKRICTLMTVNDLWAFTFEIVLWGLIH